MTFAPNPLSSGYPNQMVCDILLPMNVSGGSLHPDRRRIRAKGFASILLI